MIKRLVVTSAQLDIFLKYDGCVDLFLEDRLTEQEMGIISWPVWERLELLMRVSSLLRKNCGNERFLEFSEKLFDASCETEDLKHRILNFDTDKLYAHIF